MLRLALVFALIGVVPGCKSVGGFASGLGRAAGSVASGVARAVPAVASGVVHAGATVASGVAHVGPAIGRATLHTLPAVGRAIDIAAAVATSGGDGESEITDETDIPAEPVVAVVDPCEACPITVDCGSCVGYRGYACMAESTSCVSSAPPN